MCKSSKSSHGLPITSTVGVARVLPSGKVYRQIFDDEVCINLVHALGRARNKITQHKVLPGKIPLVRDLERRTSYGFLSERQEIWSKAMPNDQLTENPVQYKEAVTQARAKAKESESVIAAREVRGLADSPFFPASAPHRLSPLCSQMINQALLANRRATSKLFLNLMEILKRLSQSDSFSLVSLLLSLLLSLSLSLFPFLPFLAPSFSPFLPPFLSFLFFFFPSSPLSFFPSFPFPPSHRLFLPHFFPFLPSFLPSFLPFSPQDTHNVQSIMRIRLQYEKVCQECLEKLQECKVSFKIGPSLVRIVSFSHLLHGSFLILPDCFQADFEYLVKNSEINCRHLYQYFQDVLAIFDVHQQKLIQQDHELQKALNDCRCKHENMNKVRAPNVNCCSLEKGGWKGSDSPVFLSSRYTVFHQDLLSKVTAYPRHVRHELLSYSAAISRYFYVLGSYKGVGRKKTKNTDRLIQHLARLAFRHGHSSPSDPPANPRIYWMLSLLPSFSLWPFEVGPAARLSSSCFFLSAPSPGSLRLQFFEHLEQWFDDTLASTWVVVVVKKEELSAELQLRLHLHEPRRERIEKDVYNVRMAELRIHSDRLKRHCAALIEALNKERGAFFKIREDHNAVSKSFRNRIQEMEKVFQTESRAEKVMALSRNLHMELLNHVEVLQVSMRSYRQYLEEALGKLRDSNTEFLKACRLFADGGNFSPEELEIFMKQLQKENSRIEFVEGLIMIDMEKAETGYLEQATETITKFENRFRYLAMDRVFLERIQRFLTNIQVKIKTEVPRGSDSTSRSTFLPFPSITPEKLYEFTKSVMEELKKRCKYLNCQLRIQVRRRIPPGMGFTWSLFFFVSRPRADFGGVSGVGGLWGGRGHTPNHRHGQDRTCSPWFFLPASFSLLLFLKEFYKKDKHQITKPDCLQETYDLCIDALGQKMLTYLFQSDEYHIACISGLWLLWGEINCAWWPPEQDLPFQFKDKNMAQLHTSLGHPDNIPVLEALCQEEEKRQEEQVESILICTRKLEVPGVSFFMSQLMVLPQLPRATSVPWVDCSPCQKIPPYFQLKSLLVHQIKPTTGLLKKTHPDLIYSFGKISTPPIFSLGCSFAFCRTWPGIPQTTNPSLPDRIIFPETASVTTAKTTLGHVAAVEERDAVYTVKQLDLWTCLVSQVRAGDTWSPGRWKTGHFHCHDGAGGQRGHTHHAHTHPATGQRSGC
uniref:DUF4456 domain-containing protein n=1 Tax=Pseudonaja textilis TaxID=8673 RepID=A0A670Y8Y8_PSETE